MISYPHPIYRASMHQPVVSKSRCTIDFFAENHISFVVLDTYIASLPRENEGWLYSRAMGREHIPGSLRNRRALCQFRKEYTDEVCLGDFVSCFYCTGLEC